MYNCSSTECTCTFHSNHQAPCRHILLKREDDTGSLLSVFCRSLFHERYHKQTSLGDTKIASIDTSEFTDDLLPIDNESTVAKVLTSREKYKLIIPVAMNIATLASSHGTEQFMTYLSAMREVENLVRAGKQISCTSAVRVMKENGAVQPAVHNERGEAPRNVPQECSSEDTPHPVDSSKFRDLKFRPKLKARGRPKRSQRQLCSFNKSSADREAVPRRGRKRKNGTKLNSGKRRRLPTTNDSLSDYCPVCRSMMSPDDEEVIIMDCCQQLIHRSCRLEFHECPDCAI
jgi:hypothetical protein